MFIDSEDGSILASIDHEVTQKVEIVAFDDSESGQQLTVMELDVRVVPRINFVKVRLILYIHGSTFCVGACCPALLHGAQTMLTLAARHPVPSLAPFWACWSRSPVPTCRTSQKLPPAKGGRRNST